MLLKDIITSKFYELCEARARHRNRFKEHIKFAQNRKASVQLTYLLENAFQNYIDIWIDVRRNLLFEILKNFHVIHDLLPTKIDVDCYETAFNFILYDSIY